MKLVYIRKKNINLLSRRPGDFIHSVLIISRSRSVLTGRRSQLVSLTVALQFMIGFAAHHEVGKKKGWR